MYGLAWSCMTWYIRRSSARRFRSPFRCIRCRGRDAIVPLIRLTAHQTALYVRAVDSVTFSPERDCEPMRFQRDWSQAFGSVRDMPRLKYCLILSKKVKEKPPSQISLWRVL